MAAFANEGKIRCLFKLSLAKEVTGKMDSGAWFIDHTLSSAIIVDFQISGPIFYFVVNFKNMFLHWFEKALSVGLRPC